MAVSPSFLLFHPAFSYLAITELGGEGKGGKKKKNDNCDPFCVFIHIKAKWKSHFYCSFEKFRWGEIKKGKQKLLGSPSEVELLPFPPAFSSEHAVPVPASACWRVFLPFAPACSVSASSQGREPQTSAFNLSKGSSGSETWCANLPCLMGALGPALKYWVAEKESVMGDQFEMVNRLSRTVPGNTFFFWVIFMWEHEEGKQGKLTSVFTWN